jgi:hypothetical protein
VKRNQDGASDVVPLDYASAATGQALSRRSLWTSIIAGGGMAAALLLFAIGWIIAEASPHRDANIGMWIGAAACVLALGAWGCAVAGAVYGVMALQHSSQPQNLRLRAALCAAIALGFPLLLVLVSVVSRPVR